MAQPKTIIITQIPSGVLSPSNSNKHIALRGFTNPMKMASILPQSGTIDELSTPSQAGTRKRQRLDHLSFEEKIMRRKLKNRVAAQTARDRKKARMQDLEEDTKELGSKITSLETENQVLRLKNSELEKENAELRERLGLVDIIENISIKQKPIEDVSAPKTNPHQPLEYASLISDPLQKGQDQVVVALWMMHFVGWLMLSLMNSLMSCSSSAKRSMTIRQALSQEMKPKKIQNLHPVMEWWGPQQRSWNPSKNL